MTAADDVRRAFDTLLAANGYAPHEVLVSPRCWNNQHDRCRSALCECPHHEPAVGDPRTLHP